MFDLGEFIREKLGVSTGNPQNGKADNPGFIPLQNSGVGGRGYVANLQPATQPRINQSIAHQPAKALGYSPRPRLQQAYMEHGDVLLPNSPEQALQRRLQLKALPPFKRWEDGSVKIDNTFLPAFNSINDFLPPR